MYHTFEEVRDSILSNLESLSDSNTTCFVSYHNNPELSFIGLQVQNFKYHESTGDILQSSEGNIVRDALKLPYYLPTDGQYRVEPDFCIQDSKFDKLKEYVDYLQSQGKRVKLQCSMSFDGNVS